MRRARPTRAALPLAAVASLGLAGQAIATSVAITGGTADFRMPLNHPGAQIGSLIDISPELVRGIFGKLDFSVGSPVNSNTAAERPTTATFDPADPVRTFAGAIEFRGYVTYVLGVLGGRSIDLGDYALRYDPARAGTINGLASGFYLRDNRPGAPAIPFDIRNDFRFSASPTSFSLSGVLVGAPDLSALYTGFTDEFLGTPIGFIDLAATAQPMPLPPAVYPALMTLFVGTVIPAVAGGIRRRRRA